MATTPTKLILYNRALRILGERQLHSTTGLTEARKPRYLLDGAWNDNLRENCLEAGLWNFAMRTVQASYDSDVTPSFGHTYAFSKPTDFIRTAEVSTDEYFSEPLLSYTDEQGYWYASVQTVYFKYVSDDSSYGLDYSIWPDSFTNYVAHHLAGEIITGLTKDHDFTKEFLDLLNRSLVYAKNKDAMAEPTKFPPQGNWVRSRRGGTGTSWGDRGSRGRLTG